MRSSLLALPVLMAMAVPLQAADAPAMPQHQGMSAHGHGAMALPDSREPVAFPPEMRAQQLRNMRDHVEALDGILTELGEANYDAAARIATDRLGLDSPSAAACKPKQPGAAPAKGSMDEMMDLYMPEAMRSIGLAMHTAASNFAAVVRDAAKSGDTRAAYAALGQVTHNCVACHSTYRLQ